MPDMTIQQVKAKLIEKGEDTTAAAIESVVEKYDHLSYDEMERKYSNGVISEAEWYAFLYLWRNTRVRYSNIAQGWDLQP